MGKMAQGMTGPLLAGGILVSAISPALPAEGMLQWCVKAYPNRIDWCKSQYPGTIYPPVSNQIIASPSGIAPAPVPPSIPLKQLSDLEMMLPRISGRLSDKVPAFKVGQDGRFEAEALAITKALYASLKYASITFDNDGDCNMQSAYDNQAEYLDCTIYEKDADFSVSVSQPSGMKTTSKAVISYNIEDDKSVATNIFGFAIVADALSRMLDPELTDDQRADVFTKLGDSYFASGRTEGSTSGKQAKYVLTEEGGTFALAITPLASNAAEQNLSSHLVNPVLALAASLNRMDVIKPDPLDAPEIQSQVTQRREAIRSLLAQLDLFRYSYRFHTVGFAECCEYNSWLKKLVSLRMPDGADDPVRNALLRVGFVGAFVGLDKMASDYMYSDGKDTADTIEDRKDVMKFLNGR